MLVDCVSVYLADGVSRDEVASTIVDATSLVPRGAEPTTGGVRILRVGAVSRERLEEVLGDLLEPDAQAPESDGDS